jgi:hypothetical protein
MEQALKRLSKDDIHKIGVADDFHVAPYRDDRKTYGTPTWVWSVEASGNLYIRAYNGKRSSWYQAAVKQKAGKIVGAGMTRQVDFEPIEGKLNDEIDEAYRKKYKNSPYLEAMISRRVTEATVMVK